MKIKKTKLKSILAKFFTAAFIFTSVSCSALIYDTKTQGEAQQENSIKPSVTYQAESTQLKSIQSAPTQSESTRVNSAALKKIKPDRINITFYGSSKSGRAFTWCTEKKAASVVQTTETSAADLSKAASYSGSETRINTGSVKYYVHSVIVSGLKSGTKYNYRVGDDKNNVWSGTGTFRTSSDNQAFSFIHITDSQGGYKQTANVLKQAFALYPKADIIAHTGDVIDNTKWDESEWSDFFNLSKTYLTKTTIAPATGNHESGGYNGLNMFNAHFKLNTPKGADTSNGSYYSFDYEDAHFTVINTNDLLYKNGAYKLSAKQKSWLIRDLKGTKKKWKIVLMHKGIYSNGNHYMDSDVSGLRKELAPIFDLYGVNLVLQGHDHTYFRSKKMHGGKPVSSKAKGVVYVTARSCGVKFYTVHKAPGVYPACTMNGTLPVFAGVEVMNNKLTYKAYEVKNKTAVLIDAFSIKSTLQ